MGKRWPLELVLGRNAADSYLGQTLSSSPDKPQCHDRKVIPISSQANTTPTEVQLVVDALDDRRAVNIPRFGPYRRVQLAELLHHCYR